MSTCDNCVNIGEDCIRCRDNPIYADYPRTSYLQYYKPTCPKGYTDCVCDPAYIKYHHPEWYKEDYGDMTPEEAAIECMRRIEEDPNEECCYDNEDK